MVPDEEFCDGVRVMGGDGGRDGEDDGVRGERTGELGKGFICNIKTHGSLSKFNSTIKWIHFRPSDLIEFQFNGPNMRTI